MQNTSPTALDQILFGFTSTITTALIVVGIIALVLMIIQGFLAARLAAQKGYKNGVKYFLLGFFLGLIGLVYVAGKPIAPKKAAQQQKHLVESVVNALQ